MKSIITAIAFAVAAFAAPAAFADTYVGVGVGTNLSAVESFDLDDGAALDVTVGTSVATPVGDIRVEGQVARLSSDTDIVGLELNVNALEYSATAFYDIPVGTNVRPYVGAGFSYTDGSADVLFTEIDATGYGYHLQGGFRTAVTDRVTADVGVRWAQKEIELSAFGSSADVDVEDVRLRVGFNVAL